MKVRGSEFRLPARKSFGANCAASTLTLPLSLQGRGAPSAAAYSTSHHANCRFDQHDVDSERNSFSLCVSPRPDNQHCYESLEFARWPDCKPRTPHIRRANGRVLGLAFQRRWRKRRRCRVGCEVEAGRRRQAGVDISCRKMQWENRAGAMK
jgi:hypothetical protein